MTYEVTICRMGSAIWIDPNDPTRACLLECLFDLPDWAWGGS